MIYFFKSLFVLGFFVSNAPSFAAVVDESVVYIECFDSNDATVSRGSGVIVSDEGHVLSARHVFFPKNVEVVSCRGSLKVADSNNTSRLIVPNRPDMGVDAAVAQFSRPDAFVGMRYCNFDNDTIRTKILVGGFPGGTKTGKPSFRAGIISTTYLDPMGVVETDGMSTLGMSGGPVVSEDGAQLIGIVAGVPFNHLGEPEFFGMTPISEFANLFPNLSGTGKSCSLGSETRVQELLAQIDALKAQVERSTNPFVEVSRLSESHVVSITCRDGDQSPSVGTGVIISDKGHILTAGSIAPENMECSAQIGSRTSPDDLRIFHRHVSDKLDAVVLQMGPSDWNRVRSTLSQRQLAFRSVSSVEPGSEIAVTGFPSHGEIGLPTLRRGYLATNFESEERTVEAALDVVRGMSGAPILDSNSNIIGLILGVKFDSTGQINFTSALTSDYLAQEFQSFIQLTD